jgi:hypothetical protein
VPINTKGPARPRVPSPDARVSLTQLMQYCEANPARRERLRLEMAEPPAFKTAYYQDAHYFIARALRDLSQADRILNRGIELVSKRPVGNEYQSKLREANIAALTKAKFLAHDRKLQQMEITAVSSRPSPLRIEGVRVNVTPDVMVAATWQGGAAHGAVRLYFAKNDTLSIESLQLGAALLPWYLEEACHVEADVRPNLCHIADVFGQRLIAAPQHRRRRRELVAAACREIRTNWPQIAA